MAYLDPDGRLLVRELSAERTEGPTVGADSEFRGSPRQMICVAATVLIRDFLEPIHEGFEVKPGTRVRWPGGECLYAEVARIDPLEVEGMIRRFRRRLGEDIVRFVKGLRDRDEAVIRNLMFRIVAAARWDLPLTCEDEIVERFAAIRDEVILPLGGARPPRERIRRAVGAERFLRDFLEPLASGNPEPLRAAAAGEKVEVVDDPAPVSWMETSHLSDLETEMFNRGLSSHLYATLIAVERACGRIEFERPFRVPVFLPA